MNDKKQFLEWLRRNGAEVLAPTNSYEYARFRARGAVHVIYLGRRGFTASGFGRECFEAFNNSQLRLDMGLTKKPREWLGKRKAAILERDGNECFYCQLPMLEGEMTIEHLVSHDKGGPDHMDNLALAHEVCNRRADNLPLIEKIKIRESNRRAE